MATTIFDAKQRLLVVLAAVAAVVAIFASQFAPPQKPASADEAKAALAETIQGVRQRWPKLDHATTGDVEQKIADGDVILIDARSDDEFKVSHLKNAEHVKPDTSAADFVSRFGDRVQGKDVVFYCAVGVRSSTLATRVAEQLKSKGAKSVTNMAGGIFAWHNQNRPLVDKDGATDKVHSYDEWWGRMVARPEKIKNKP